MARRIKSRKNKYLGNRTYGGGNTKNRRGKGNKGGKGNAGFHKHNWLRTIKRGEHKHRKYGFHSVRDKLDTITLEAVNHMISLGKFEKLNGLYAVNLLNTKVVGSGELTFPALIKANAFTKSALKKIESAGGKAAGDLRNENAVDGEAGEQPAGLKAPK